MTTRRVSLNRWFHIGLVLCFLAGTGTSFAQTSGPGSLLRGRVTDQTGGAAAGIPVVLSSPGASLAVRTDAFGDYRFGGLSAGTYQLEIDIGGFSPVRRSVTVADRQAVTEDVVLEIPIQAATVVVSASASASLARTDTAILELPQSVQVIDEKVLEQQQVVRLENVFRNVSGVNQFSAYQDFNVRGFRSGEDAVLYNGNRAGLYTFWTSPMLANIDRVEVLKGPASVLYGSGQPGGLINLVTKKPEPRFRNQLAYTLGHFDQHRSQMDSTGPLNRSRTLLYRLNAAYFNSGSFRWFNRSENYLVAPAVTWVMTERSRLTLEMELMQDNRKAQRDRGIIAPRNNVDLLPVGFTVQEPSDFQNNSGDAVQLTYIHSFGSTWSANVTARHTRNRYRDSYHEPRTFSADFSSIARQYRDFNRYASRKWLNSYASGEWVTGRVRHNLTFGADFGYQGDDVRGDRIANPVDGVPALNLVTLNYGLADPLGYRFTNRRSADGDSRQYALYARDQLALTNTLRVMGGIRVTGFKDRSINFNEITTAITREEASDQAVLTQAGVVWLPWADSSLYANFAESFLPQGPGTIVFGGPFDPERGRQFEFGGKREWFGSRLSSTLAFFNIERQNVLVTDPDSPQAFLIPIGEVTSRGIELDVIGKLTDRLNLTMNYAYLDAKVTEDTDLFRVGRRSENAPRNATNIWAYYQFPFWNLSAGAGVSYVSRRPTFDTLVIPGCTVANATVSWQQGPLKLTATMDNLANRRYFLGGYGARTLFPGSPRVWLLSSTFTF
ncbi:MAG: TonB-dependent siderophore receptor [Bryobacterales bacterium]|nr:TonB-dependent siderophore receptor [Bryobacterales bacterium]